MEGRGRLRLRGLEGVRERDSQRFRGGEGVYKEERKLALKGVG